MFEHDLTSRHRILFVSSNGTQWGGSEELWSAAAAVVAEAGHVVTIAKPSVDLSAPRLKRLSELSCAIHDLGAIPFVPRLAWRALGRLIRPFARVQRAVALAVRILLCRPELIVVSQGGNYDGVMLADVCRRMKKRYVLISQKAGETYWPGDEILPMMRSVFVDAVATCFVSEHNLRLTEDQIGTPLPNASVVRNPFLVAWEKRDDWPSEEGGLRLACVGRLYPREKGQDLVLRVLSKQKWRDRAVSVTFIGSGGYRAGLEGMARRHELRSVSFAGFIDDVESIWDDHHGLILPSRCEGLPLVLVEAMLSGRVAIVTNVAGNSEVVEDGQTGFLASAPVEDALDEAMERAWQRRHEWRQIGESAAEAVRRIIPRDPAAALAAMVIELADREIARGRGSHDVGPDGAEAPPASPVVAHSTGTSGPR